MKTPRLTKIEKITQNVENEVSMVTYVQLPKFQLTSYSKYVPPVLFLRMMLAHLNFTNVCEEK